MPAWCLSRPAASLLLCLNPILSSTGGPVAHAPAAEVLHYRAEWRLIHAGNVKLIWNARPGNEHWEGDLTIRSVGLVSKLYKVDNHYTVLLDRGLCASSSVLVAHEGSRSRETKVTFDSERHKASYLERDLKKGVTVAAREIDIPPCVHDVIGGLYRLRSLDVAPGKQVQLLLSDGRRSVLARVNAQQRETVQTPAGKFQTIRYEAFLFNDVLYRRKGRLFVWLTDDERRLPVQVRIRLQFHIGTVTLQLEKVESS